MEPQKPEVGNIVDANSESTGTEGSISGREWCENKPSKRESPQRACSMPRRKNLQYVGLFILLVARLIGNSPVLEADYNNIELLCVEYGQQV